MWPAPDTNPFKVDECMCFQSRSAQPTQQLCIKNMYTIRLQHLESEATQGQNSTLRELSIAPDLKGHRDPLRGAMQTVTEHTHTRNSNSLTRHWGASCGQPKVQQQTLVCTSSFLSYIVHLKHFQYLL